MQIPVKKLTETATIPAKSHYADAGFDLYSDEDIIINGVINHHTDGIYTKPKIDRKIISTGISMAIPEDHVGIIKDRSGNASKIGLHVLAGVIDSNYRGDIGVCLCNLGTDFHSVKKGDRIAQILIIPVAQAILMESDSLDDTKRGEKGFGSSGN